VGTTIQVIIASIGQPIPRYGNYIIFTRSFEHLIHNQNLYIEFPGIQNDLFKYSPAFATLMAAFFYLPDWLGFLLFQLLNITLFLYAVKKISPDNETNKYILIYLLLEVAKALTYCQTNLLIAGLLILAFDALEKRNILWGTLFITLTVYIKLFGIVAYALWFLYPKKGQFIAAAISWNVLFAFMPLIVVNPEQLFTQYQNWYNLLLMDHGGSTGISFAGWVQAFSGIELNKNLITIAAALLFCIPLIKTSCYQYGLFRKFFLASILIWVVIFNHKGESATYIIALSGVAIWYFLQEKNSINYILIWLGFLFTTAAGIDLITPGWIIRKYVNPYSVEAIGCSLIWLKLVYDQITMRHDHFKSL
jgi:hypothetical protein